VAPSDDEMLTPTGYPSSNTAADMAHSTHSTQPALRPHRATPRVKDKPSPLKRSMMHTVLALCNPQGGQVLLVAARNDIDTPGQPKYAGVLVMRGRRTKWWSVALVHTAEKMQRHGVGTSMWASALKKLNPGDKVVVEAPACLSGAASTFWKQGFKPVWGSDQRRVERVFLSYEKPAL